MKMPLGGMHLLAQRDAFIKALQEEGVDPDERDEVADSYWDTSIRYHIAQRDYEAAWHRIKAAALGNDAFTGPNRICPGHVENEPVGLVATPTAVMGYIHLLYHALFRAKMLGPLNPNYSPSAWGTLFPNGGRVKKLMEAQKDVRFRIAGLMALAIAEWSVNHRRYEHAAEQDVA